MAQKELELKHREESSLKTSEREKSDLTQKRLQEAERLSSSSRCSASCSVLQSKEDEERK